MNIYFRITSFLIITLLLAALFIPVVPTQGASDTIVVTPGSQDKDFGTNASVCTLREAIWAINRHYSFDGCIANAATNKIYLPAGNYLLTRAGSGEEASYWGDLDIRSDVTITGAGADKTLIYVDTNLTPINDRDRIFHIQNPIVNGKPKMITVTIQNLTIAGGYAQDNGGGGGILNKDATVFLRSVIIRDNEAAKGTSGGGILNNSIMTIDNSILISNLAAYFGGGIENRGQTIIKNTLITGNSANSGGGVDNLPDNRDTGYLKMSNVTVTQSLSGGGINNSGKFEGTNLTIARNNGTGLFLNGTDYAVTLRNTIIAYHSPEPACQLQYQITRFTSGGYNLIDDTKNFDPSIYICPFNSKGVTTDILDQDPLLSPVPISIRNSFTRVFDFTNTQSPAVDAIPADHPYCLDIDQLFHGRPASGNPGKPIGCDIGAYELGGSPHGVLLSMIFR